MNRPSSGTRKLKIVLLIVALVCIGVAVSYPILDKRAQLSNESELSELSALRRQRLEEMSSITAAPTDGKAPSPTPGGTPADATPAATEAPTARAEATPAATETPTASAATATGAIDDAGEGTPGPSAGPTAVSVTPDGGATPTAASRQSPEPQVSEQPGATLLVITDIRALILDPPDTPAPSATAKPTPRPTYAATPEPTQKADRYARTGALSYDSLEKVVFDEAKILPELREIYDLNHDLIGWLTIPGTNIDYPVVQSQDTSFYLDHDFYGKENVNGQIILEPKCDPFTPGYNLVISGHRMNSGAMFGNLNAYAKRDYWEEHKTIEFDTLMQRRTYVVFGVFYSADYDEHEEGFRYNADIRYRIDAENWLSEVAANAIYDTGVDVQFGDEFLTLTTCVKTSYTGRFVVVARRLREGETVG